MTEFNGQLYLFTKDWQTQTTTVYRFPVKPGSYVAIKEEKFNSSGLISGADISPDKTKLALIGYNRYSCFIWLFNLNEPGSFFKGDKTFCYFPSIRGAQTEGICFKDNNTLLISNEKSKNYKPKIFEINLDYNFH
jgi:hypothetical protein